MSRAELNVDALLSIVDLKPDRIWHRGEFRRASKPEGEKYNDSGITFVASIADFDEFRLQLDEATSYLETHEQQIAVITSFEGVQEATLDFGIELCDAWIHSDILPPRFLRAAAVSGISVELSHYPKSEDKYNSKQGAAPNP
ncbi:hypothetical protein [Luteolibacter pohnpeiensis]|uniref:hypothetical protein n=1 Tax=Luteolibacter pohnpeiensis TaxID=454153 RepID=UPI00190862C9|nr:hypothetical protein [Luteolibacter pohnpeiensis]